MNCIPLLPVLALFITAGCDAIPGLTSPEVLVRNGDGRACSHPQALALVDMAIRGEADRAVSDEERAAVPMSFDTIAMTSVEEGVKIFCETRVVFADQRTAQFAYELLPSSDRPGELLIRWEDQRQNGIAGGIYFDLRITWQQTAERRSSPPAETLASFPPHSEPPAQDLSARLETSGALAQFTAEAVSSANDREKRASAANGDPVEDAYRFQASAPMTRFGDLDGDGDEDVIFLVGLCEETNCHPTTQLTAVALMKNDGGALQPTIRQVLEGPGEIQSITGATVVVQTLVFGPDDPSCCASMSRVHRIRMP